MPVSAGDVDQGVPLLMSPLIENDWDIPHSHSSVLFDTFIDHHFANSTGEKAPLRSDVVSTIQISGYGTLEQVRLGTRRVALLKTETGGHHIGKVEGVQDTIGRLFDLYSV